MLSFTYPHHTSPSMAAREAGSIMLQSETSEESLLRSLDLESAPFLSTFTEGIGGAGCVDISDHMTVENVVSGKETATRDDQQQGQTCIGSKSPDRDPKSSQTELVLRKLEKTIADMASKVEQLEQQVLQVTRIRSTLKRSKSEIGQVCNPSKDREKGSTGNKKQRLLDAARNEAARRRRMSELVRLFTNILRQLMQHKWAWPFMKPVDVEGLRLHDYYRVIRKPMDLGTIENRLRSKDGSGYRHVREMCEDVRLVFRNAMIYNESWTDVHKMAKTLWQKFEEKWKMTIEPRLIEEEENYCEDQKEGYVSEIAELRAGEEQAAEQLGDDVLLQLTNIENQLEGFITKLLSKCRAMRVEEKQELGMGLCELPPSCLNRVIEIVSAKTNALDAATEKVQVDLEALDVATLWRLQFFVKMVTQARAELTARNINSTEDQTGGPSHT